MTLGTLLFRERYTGGSGDPTLDQFLGPTPTTYWTRDRLPVSTPQMWLATRVPDATEGAVLLLFGDVRDDVPAPQTELLFSMALVQF